MMKTSDKELLLYLSAVPFAIMIVYVISISPTIEPAVIYNSTNASATNGIIIMNPVFCGYDYKLLARVCIYQNTTTSISALNICDLLTNSIGLSYHPVFVPNNFSNGGLYYCDIYGHQLKTNSSGLVCDDLVARFKCVPDNLSG